MKLTSLDNFNFRIWKKLLNPACKFLPRIPTIDQELIYGRKGIQVEGDHLYCTVTVSNICAADMKYMGQPQCIYGNVQLNSGNFFPAVIPFFFRCVHIFDTLGVNDPKGRAVLFEELIAEYGG